MAWIKRNLFFVIGATIALGLLAAAGFYDYKNWQGNKNALDQLNQAYSTLQNLNSKNPSPGNDKINNIRTAGDQEKELRAWIQQAGQYFKPITPVPNPGNGVVTDAQFASARDHTLSQLQAEASDASVTLPPQYGFSFEAERSLVKFAPGSLVPLSRQLGDVKTLCEILHAAKINSLDSIRRVPVSPDDASGPQSDYLSESPVTNNLAVFTPYEITFRCFSQNLASVLSSLASSPHGFIVQGANVQPASGVSSASTESQAAGQPPGFSPFGGSGYGGPGYPQRSPFAPPIAQMAPRNSSGLQTVLDEQLLSITLDVEIVKLLPGN
jgi:hypothetical protein